MTATLTADEQALLATICANPAEDTPRLVLADWWEEHGRPERAEFVRVQIELARLPDCGHDRKGLVMMDGSCRACPLRRRERELWGLVCQKIIDHELHQAVFGNDATVTTPTEERNANAAVTVRRGFVHSVTLPLAAFLGGPCGWCWGTGIRHGSPPPWAEWGTDKCGYCSGTGRTPGAAAGLRWMPVERVTFGDKRPTPMLGHEADRGRGAWYDQGLLDAAFPGEGPHPYGVPAELFGLLTGHVDGARGGMAWYDTEADALSALSAAAVAYLCGLRGG
jgi:uncharacterized protein (TIGR02996 family)